MNHVLEHVPDDIEALDELDRILEPSGVLALSIPLPLSYLSTIDWGYPDPQKSNHYRTYGSDFPTRVRDSSFKAAVQVIETDRATNTRDIVYFLSQDEGTLTDIGNKLIRAGAIVLWAA